MKAVHLGITLRALNIFDAASTVYAMSEGASELNPIMRALIDVHPLLFVFVKVLVVGLGAAYLEHRNAVWALYVANAVYVVVVAWQIANLLRHFGGA